MTLGRAMFTAALVLASVASAQGQSPASKPDSGTDRVRWHKYVNHHFGFSFWYPDTYSRAPLAPAEEEAKYSSILFQRRDNPDAGFSVSISADPFRLYPGAGDLMPTRQMIGHHAFYKGMGGSMARGFSDFYVTELRGKALSFVFGPDDGVNPSEETKQLEFRMLKTFRTF